MYPREGNLRQLPNVHGKIISTYNPRPALWIVLTINLHQACGQFAADSEQAMQTHPDISLVTARQQTCSRFTPTYVFLAIFKAFIHRPLICLPDVYQSDTSVFYTLWNFLAMFDFVAGCLPNLL